VQLRVLPGHEKTETTKDTKLHEGMRKGEKSSITRTRAQDCRFFRLTTRMSNANREHDLNRAAEKKSESGSQLSVKDAKLKADG